MQGMLFQLTDFGQLAHALEVCVYPFIPVDLAKIVVGVLFGMLVWKALTKARLQQ